MVPHAFVEDENAAYSWLRSRGTFPIGFGQTPDDAYADLIRRLLALEPARRFEPTLDGGYSLEWELEWPDGQRSSTEFCHPGS